MMVSCLVYPSIFAMDTTCYSETVVYFLRTTLRYIPEDRILQVSSFTVSPTLLVHCIFRTLLRKSVTHTWEQWSKNSSRERLRKSSQPKTTNCKTKREIWYPRRVLFPRINVENGIKLGFSIGINVLCTLKLKLYWNITTCAVQYLLKLPKVFNLQLRQWVEELGDWLCAR
jgi:hypothetical protein